jgi:hypothetical protein
MMAKFILNVPEPLVAKAAGILADVLRDYPASKSCGILTPKHGYFYVRLTKTGASIAHFEPVEKPITVITDGLTGQ